MLEIYLCTPFNCGLAGGMVSEMSCPSGWTVDCLRNQCFASMGSAACLPACSLYSTLSQSVLQQRKVSGSVISCDTRLCRCREVMEDFHRTMMSPTRASTAVLLYYQAEATASLVCHQNNHNISALRLEMAHYFLVKILSCGMDDRLMLEGVFAATSRDNCGTRVALKHLQVLHAVSCGSLGGFSFD